MGMILCGESPLYIVWRVVITIDHSKSTSRRQGRKGDRASERSPSANLRADEQQLAIVALVITLFKKLIKLQYLDLLVRLRPDTFSNALVRTRMPGGVGGINTPVLSLLWLILAPNTGNNGKQRNNDNNEDTHHIFIQ
jgi:hypothetical protein